MPRTRAHALGLCCALGLAALAPTGLAAAGATDADVRDELAGAPNDDGSARPAVLPLDPAAPDPLGVPLFLRGTMNGFGTGEPLAYAGAYAYEGTTRIPAAGRYELKFADAAFSAGANFGAPFGVEGVSAGPFTGNLSVELPAAGDYGVQLFVVPLDGRPLRFFRLSPGALP